MKTNLNHLKAWLTMLVTLLITAVYGQLVVTPTVSHMSCGETNNGSISLSVSGGTSPYTYKWSTSATTSSVTALAAGAYTATVYDNTNDSIVRTIDVGYKTTWDTLIKYEEDSLGRIRAVNTNGLNDNYTFGLNRLSAHTDGWLEYVIAAGDTVQGFLGFATNMNRDETSQGYGFYLYGNYILLQGYTMPGTPPVLGTYTKGNAYRFRISVKGDSISFIQMSGSGVILAKKTFATPAQGGSAGVLGMVHGNRIQAVYSSFDCSLMRLTFEAEPVRDVHTTGNVITNIRGGAAPYTYLWSNGSTSKDLNNTGVGDYTLVVTDNNSATISNNILLGAYVSWEPLINIVENENHNIVGIEGAEPGGDFPAAFGLGLNAIEEDTLGILLYEFDRATDFAGIVGFVSTDTATDEMAGMGLIILPEDIDGFEDDGLYFMQPDSDMVYLGSIGDSVPLKLKMYKDNDTLKIVKNDVVTMTFYYNFNSFAMPMVVPYFTGAKVTRATCNFVTYKPLPPTVPGGSQSVCSVDTAYTFVLDSIRAGSGGDKVVWSLDGSFSLSDTLNSYDSLHIEVSKGQSDTLWLKSWSSERFNVSNVITVVLSVDTVLPPTNNPQPQTAWVDTPYTFIFENVIAGSGGDQVEWALNPNFIGSTISASPASISVTVDTMSTDTIWIRSRGTSGCISSVTITTATVRKPLADGEELDSIVAYDRHGNKFEAGELVIPQAFAAQPAQCDAGYFELYFTDVNGIGFDNAFYGTEAQQTACQVFKDLSELIVPEDPNFKVAIVLGTAPSFLNLPAITSDAIADATSIYLYPPGACPGVSDGQVYKAITTGQDPYHGSPVYAQYHIDNTTKFMNGLVRVNWDKNFFTGLDIGQGASPSEYDLYSVLLHEVLHMLGIAGTITQTGAGGISPGVYTRFDRKLVNASGTPLLNTDGCYCVSYNSSISTTGGANTVFFDDANYILPIFTPPTWIQGSSMTHFEPNGSCGSSTDFVMTPSIALGCRKRFPFIEEGAVLCDVGYNISDHYGDNPISSYGNYNSGYATCSTNQISGVDDAVIVYTGQSNDFIILSNDVADGCAGGIPEGYKCLRLFNSGAGNLVPGPNASTATFTPNPGFYGMALASYIPICNGEEGAPTFIYIRVTGPQQCPAPPSCNPSDCNLVCNGDFESVNSVTELRCAYSYYYPGGTGQLNSTDLIINGILNHNFNGPGTNNLNFSCPTTNCNGFYQTAPTPVPLSANPVTNHNYVGMGYGGSNLESVTFPLNTMITGPQSYRVSFKANNLPSCSIDPQINVTGSELPPCFQQYVNLNSFSSVTCPGSTNTYQQLNLGSGSLNIPIATGWNTYSFVFTPPSDMNFITFTIVRCSAYSGGYLGLDDIVVTPSATLTATATATAYNCSTGTSQLGVTVSGGPSVPYTYSWSNAATLSDANISNPVASPAVTTTYTVTVSNGCHADATATVTVNVDAPVITAVVNNACNGGSSGSIDATITGGETPYIYAWSNSATSEDINSLANGPYTLTVTDDNGCSSSATYTILQSSSINVSATPTDGCNSNININHTGGTSPYTYLWSDGGATTTEDIVIETTGNYTVTVTDANGCSASVSASVVAYKKVELSAIISNVPCMGGTGSINLSVDDGIPPFTYVWSNAATSQDISGSGITAGPYTVTVMGDNGCSTSATYNITDPEPFALQTFTEYGNCNSNTDASIEVNPQGGVEPYTFIWSDGPSDDQDRENLGVFPYVVTVTDANGCIVNANVPVYSQSPIIITLEDITSSDGCNGTNDGSIDISVSGGFVISGVTYTYAWSIPTADPDVQDITNLAPGTYSVTVSQTSGFGSGCDAVATFLVGNAPTCCFSEEVDEGDVIMVTANSNASALTVPTGSYLYIANGVVLTVTPGTPFVLDQCEVVMGSNAEIQVQSGAVLEVTDTYIHGCDELWDGIYAQGGSEVDVDGSTIEDAMNGIIFIGFNSEMSVINTDFHRNQRSISFYFFFPANAADYNISGCTFSMGGYTTMLPAPAGFINYNRPISGVFVGASGDLTLPNSAIGGNTANTFHDLNNGVYMLGTRLILLANTFTDIRRYDAFNGGGFMPIPGAAVNAAGGVVWAPNRSLEVRPMATAPGVATAPHFANCDFGVFSDRIRVNVANCRMNNVRSGIHAQNSVNRVILTSNFMTATNQGITLTNNISAISSAVGNTIFVNAPTLANIGNPSPPPLIIPNTYGISLSEASNATPINSSILLNNIFDGRNCIALNNVNGAQIIGNALNQTSVVAVNGTQAGIFATNCRALQVSTNTVIGNSNTYNETSPMLAFAASNRKIGIHLSQTVTSQVCNNTLGGTTTATGIGYGMQYTANCGNVRMLDNTMRQSRYGTMLRGSMLGTGAIIPDQGFNGSSTGQRHQNTFQGPFNNASLNRTFTLVTQGSGMATYNPPDFWHNSTDASAGNRVASPSGAILNGSATPGAAVQPRLITALSTPTLSCGTLYNPFPNWFFMKVAKGETNDYLHDDYDDAGTYLSEKAVYQILREDTSLLGGDTILNQFYVNTITSDIGKADAYELTILALADSILLTDSAAYNHQLDTLWALNNRLMGSSAQHVKNHYIANAIYQQLLRHPEDTLSGGQRDTLEALAMQCPYAGGDAVYLARTLLVQGGTDQWHYDDIALCEIESSSKKEQETDDAVYAEEQNNTAMEERVEYALLYPNPAGNSVKLDYMAYTEGLAAFTLYNNMGAVVLKSDMQAGQNSATFDISRLSAGIYYWRLNDSGRTIKTGKLSIAR